jgi:vitamin B12/bleomycin/antimicrobial peptide transport system ATP-binding/permease protein
MPRARDRLSVLLVVLALVGVAAAQVWVQYLLNAWNRDFFDALERHDVAALWHHVRAFVPRAALNVALAVVALRARMTAQRRWRALLTHDLLAYWVERGRYKRLDPRDHGHANAEHRIGEDARIATEAPVELAVALLTSVVTAATFFSVLWQIGGELTVRVGERAIVVHGYLVLGVVCYAVLFTSAMLWLGARLTEAIEDKNQAEAEFHAAATLLREVGEGKAPAELEPVARERLDATEPGVFASWRGVCRQLMRTTWVSHANFLCSPVVAWFLCAPKYLAGELSLGELTQAAAAFVTVLGAFNWLVDNFQRVADWRSSVDRVASLLLALDRVDAQLPSAPLPLEGLDHGP